MREAMKLRQILIGMVVADVILGAEMKHGG